MEAADRFVVAGHLALALQHVDFNRRLTVGRRTEDLTLARRDRRVALNQRREDTTQGFDPER